MCGIAGIVYKDGSRNVREETLHEINKIQRHRGPNDQGIYLDGNVGLAHTRLSIIDIEGGKQPMTSHDGNLIVVYNGEIYNYLDIRSKLIGKGYRFKTLSDTEVLLYAYEAYGTECVDHFNGMFAFAIFDKKRRTIFCARDRVGVKPFYYYFDGRTFIFASEIKAILKTGEITSEVCPHALKDYVRFQFCLDEKTLFKHIKKLNPGTWLLLDLPRFKTNLTHYWDPNYTYDTYHNEDYFIDRLLLLCEDSVRLRLRSDVPVGAYLSGGVDSSLVTCLASHLNDGSFSTFTGKFTEGTEYDESGFAKMVSEFAGTTYYEIAPSSADFVEAMPKLIYFMDEPAAGPGLFPQYFVSKLSAEHVTVVLGGQGGDEVFGGYIRYVIGYLEQCLKGSIFETYDEDKYFIGMKDIVENLPLIKSYVPLLAHLWQAELFEPMDRRYFRLVDRSENSHLIYSDDVLNGSTYDVYEAFSELFNRPKTESYFNKMTYFDMRTLLPALLHVEDRMSMAVSLESRVPLLDYRIIELIASIPANIKFKGGMPKYLLKKAVANIIPRDVLDRKDKKGFPVPLTEWISGPLKEFIGDTLLSRRVHERGIFKPEGIRTAIEKEGKFDRNIWGALCLELWYQQFLD